MNNKSNNVEDLIFNNPKSSDAGIYQCIATNDYGVALGNPTTITEGERLDLPSQNVSGYWLCNNKTNCNNSIIFF